MPTNVVMPQMGESIAEGTIVRWIKKVGDAVDRDEPLFEISTDKVDAEIPSPGAGVLTEIKVKEGETVPVNSVVAVIGSAGEKAAEKPESGARREPSEMPQAAVGQPEAAAAVEAATSAEAEDLLPDQPPASPGRSAEALRAKEERGSDKIEESGPSAGMERTDTVAGPVSKEDLRRQKSSPLVRRIAREHNVDIQRIQGTGVSGRVTKGDILSFIESGAAAGPALSSVETETAKPPVSQPPTAPGPAFRPGERTQVVPMTIMRKKIAEHMVLSARTSPHVYSVYEVNFGRLAQLREKKKSDYERAGAKLTFTALIAKVVVDALRAFPVVNASLDGDNIVYKKDINLGIAVALEQGLIVPVIKYADEKNLLGLSRAIDDIAVRARSKKLHPEEVQGGTFTITNPGVFGAVYGLPLINQPQVAILGVGGIEKRAVVIDDAIAIRPTCHLSLGYDHRLIDGADAGRYLSFIKDRLEHFDEAWM
ncbi:MAG: 2-oxoglutarate dehydrogenase, E2 component, dihydrolipoamide succinyltransferase [Acidobacteria bacterium]|nr:MAG: 2-oxoglutarate dehydrogenase, E2 component, dihydrolipoamide succinyltransferase [Acidobacteriota bacterium]